MTISATIIQATPKALKLELYNQYDSPIHASRWVPRSIVQSVIDVDLIEYDVFQLEEDEHVMYEFEIADWFIENYEMENQEDFYPA